MFYLPLWPLEWASIFPTYTGSFMMVQPEMWTSMSKEGGRGGRDGCLCEVVLYSFSGSTKGQINSDMKNYSKNTELCRRIQLMQYFPGKMELPQELHLCCDICSMQCLCGCTCVTCSCDKPVSLCAKCCTCAKRCTYVQIEKCAGEATNVHYDMSSSDSSNHRKIMSM